MTYKYVKYFIQSIKNNIEGDISLTFVLFLAWAGNRLIFSQSMMSCTTRKEHKHQGNYYQKAGFFNEYPPHEFYNQPALVFDTTDRILVGFFCAMNISNIFFS